MLGLALLVSPRVARAESPQEDASATAQRFDISASPLADALTAFGVQSGLQVSFARETVAGLRSPGLQGDATPAEALEALLRGNQLEYSFLNGSTVVIRRAQPPSPTVKTATGTLTGRVTQAGEPVAGATVTATSAALEQPRVVTTDEEGNYELTGLPPGVYSLRFELEGLVPVVKEAEVGPEDSTKLDVQMSLHEVRQEIAVTGRIFNVDLPRTPSDPQAYYIIDAKTIDQSGATTLQDLLKNRLTMNQIYSSSTQFPLVGANLNRPGSSSISLRGIGAGFDTLILVNGRRQPAGRLGAGQAQPDLNGIPLAAIDTIEVLPASAAGIYGGSAVGGVVNVILKQNYTGMEVRASHNNVLDGDAAVSTFDLAGGKTLEGGKTHLMFTATYLDPGQLRVGERSEIVQRYVETVRSNNPNYLGIGSVGSTTNIQSVSGGNLTLDSGIPLGASRTFIPPGYTGVSADGGQALVNNAGLFNTDMPATNQTQSPPGSLSLLGYAPEVEFVSGSVRRQMTKRLELFGDFSHGANTSRATINPLTTSIFILVPGDTSPFHPNGLDVNPFQEDVFVHVPFTAEAPSMGRQVTDRVTAGGLWQLAQSWRMQADAAWSERTLEFSTYSNPTFDNNGLNADIGSGIVNVFLDTVANPLSTESYALASPRKGKFLVQSLDYSLRAQGPLWFVSGRTPSLAVSVERREEEYDTGRVVETAPGFERIDLFPENSQTTDSAYLEVTVPLVPSGSSILGLRQLDLQLAGRHDRYEATSSTAVISSINGSPFPAIASSRSEYSSSNYTAGLLWGPIEDIALRASYATGFRPPLFNELLPAVPTGPFFSVFDPLRNELTTGVVQSFGGNANLQPETSTSFSTGVILEPRFLQGLRLSVDYTQIDKDDSITSPSAQFIVDEEESFPGRVVRGTPGPGEQFGPIVSVDTSALNANKLEVTAYDVALTYRVQTKRLRAFEFYSLATWLMHNRQQRQAGGVFVEFVNARQGPAFGALQKFKGNAGLTWRQGPWTSGWATRYTPSYWVSDDPETISAQGSDRVRSQIYHDAFISYDFGNVGEGIRGLHGVTDQLEVRLGVNNVLNEIPPLDAGSPIYLYSLFGDPRLREYTLRLIKNF